MRDVYKTKSGLEIGCMYERPLRQLNHDEEEIQRALLGIRGQDYVGWALYIILLATVFGCLLMIVGSGR